MASNAAAERDTEHNSPRAYEMDTSENNLNTETSSTSKSLELPKIPYNLREHKKSIVLYWTLILSESFFIPIALYYGLSKGTDMRAGAYFAIITACFGFVTGFEYAIRGWRLVLKSDTYRPLNSKGRWQGDTVHWTLAGPYFVMTAVMIGVSIPEPPKTRGLAVILPIGMIMISSCMIASGVAHAIGMKLPFRLSSHLKGSCCPPLTFCIFEDIVGCDGRGGRAVREAAMARYTMSPRYQQMMAKLNWVWSLSAIVWAAAVIAIVATIPQEVAYGLGWGLPTAWAITGAALTTWYVKRSVRTERDAWESEKSTA